MPFLTIKTKGSAVLAVLAAGALGACAGDPETPGAPEPEDEGQVVFEGVEEASESDLRRVIRPDLERYVRDPRPAVLADAVFRLTHFYHLQGHALVSVSSRTEGGKVVFSVVEGPEVTLGRLHFEGNRAFRDEELQQVRPRELLGGSPPFSPRLVSLMIDSILRAYGEWGYIEAVVTETRRHYEESERKMHVTLSIVEGKPHTLKAYVGLPEDPELQEKLRKRLETPYTPGTDEEVAADAIEHYRERGHPFAQARAVPRFDREGGKVVLEVEIQPGPPAVIGEVRVGGQVWVRPSFIQGRAGLEPGRPFRASDLREAEKRLRDTTLFTTVRAAPGEFQEETGQIAVDVTVEEREMGELSFRGGYGALDGARVGADMAYRNLFGGGELFRAGGTVSRFGWRAEAEVGIPYIFGTELYEGTSAYYERREYPSFEVSSKGGAISLSYPLTEEIQLGGGVRYAIIETEEVEPNVPPGDLLDFDYMALFLSASWDGRDSPILPSRGFLLSGLAEWSDDSFNSDVHFLNGSARMTGFLPLPFDLVLAASLHGGIIVPIGETEEIPISLRYFAGGTSTVRGFEFGTIGPQVDGEPTGGEVYLALQAELRFPIWGELHGAVFSDRGGVWFRHDQVDGDRTRYSVGLGLRYYTPAGALVVDVAWNPSREEDEEAVEVHLSIGFPF